MAAQRTKRARKERVFEDYVTGTELERVGTDERERKSAKRVWRAVCILTARLLSKNGDELAWQRPMAGWAQAPLRASEEREERLEYLVAWWDEEYRDAPEWIPAEQVGLPLVRGFAHLLQVFPQAPPNELTNEELRVAVKQARTFLTASVLEQLHGKLSAEIRRVSKTLSVTLKLEPAAFLSLFAHTAAYAGETYLSLLAAKQLSRCVTFEEINAALSPACATWHTLTHKIGHSVHAYTTPKRRARLSIRLINSEDFDHSHCPHCTYDGPILSRPRVCKSTRKHLFTVWEMRLTMPIGLVPEGRKFVPPKN